MSEGTCVSEQVALKHLICFASSFHLSLPRKFHVSEFPGISEGCSASKAMLPLLK